MTKKIITIGISLLLLSVGVRAQQSYDESGTRVRIGDEAPNFTVEMVDGSTIELAELKVKVVVVNFWATWCPPCREEMKRVQTDLIDRYVDQDFVFLPISRGEKREVVTDFLEKNGYEFPVALDRDAEAYGLYAEKGVPRNFVIDREGKIAAIEIGYSEELFEELIVNIEKALK